MNRRRMTMLQNKGFELIYDASSGELPQTSNGWDIVNQGTFSFDSRYLRIKGTGKYLQPLAGVTINKPQDLSKSREIAIIFGELNKCTVNFRITKPWFAVEVYPNQWALIWMDVFHHKLLRPIVVNIKDQTFKIVYDATAKVATYYMNDVLLYTENNAEAFDFALEVWGEGYGEISKITYKEW